MQGMSKTKFWSLYLTQNLSRKLKELNT